MKKINQNTYLNRLSQLFESTDSSQRFLTIQQQTINPLERVNNETILNSIIDPTTGEHYDGIVLQGEFASMDVLNNNGRKYVEENYLEFVEILKYQIHSPRGVYGELEHPKSYSVDYNNISHKILDIWYDKEQRKVFGIILLLNTPKGLIAQEVVKSGGQLAVSARGGGAEETNTDGTITAILKLLVTFDIVYHPGFTTAVVDYQNLYECQEIDIYEPQISGLKDLYENYKGCSNNNIKQLFETNNSINKDSFFAWINKDSEIKMLLESQNVDLVNKEDKQQQVLQNNQSSNEDEVEKDLEDSVDENLSESEDIFYRFQKAMVQQQQWLRKNVGDRAFYDNSAGFIDNSQNYSLD